MKQKLELTCPRCQRQRVVNVNSLIPREVFDFRCCVEQTVTARVITSDNKMTVREVTWEPAA